MSATTQGYLSEHTTVFTNVRSLGNFDVDGQLTVQNLSANSFIGHLSANTIGAESGSTINMLSALSLSTVAVSSSVSLVGSGRANIYPTVVGETGVTDTRYSYGDVRRFGASGDYDVDAGTGTDDTTAIANAIASSDVVVLEPKKRYRITDQLNCTNKTIVANGAEIWRTDDTNEEAIAVTGTVGSYSNIDSNADAGQNVIVDAGLAASLSQGDLIKIISDATFLSSGGDSLLQGEMAVVRHVSGSNIYLDTPLFDAYTTASNARIAKVAAAAFRVVGKLVIGRSPSAIATQTSGMILTYAMAPDFEVEFLNCQSVALSLTSCYAPRVRVHARNVYYTSSGLSYGVALNDATMYAQVQVNIHGVRHAVACGGSPANGGVVWGAKVHDSTGTALGSAAVFDAHEETGSIEFENVTAYGGLNADGAGNTNRADGFSVGARYCKISNCHAIRCDAAVTIRASSDVHELIVTDLHMRDCVSHGVTVDASARVRKMWVDGIRGTTSGGTTVYGVSVAPTTGQINEWHFDNIKMSVGGLLQVGGSGVVPSTLIIHNSEADDSSTPTSTIDSNWRGIAIANDDITTLILKQVKIRNKSLGLRITTSLTRLVLECCDFDTNYQHIYVDNATITHLKVLGGRFANSVHGQATFGVLRNVDGNAMTTVDLSGVYVDTDGCFAGGHSSASVATVIHGPCDLPASFNIGRILATGWLEYAAGSPNQPALIKGNGSPESTVTAPIATMFGRKNGGPSSSLYVKAVGSGNTGWAAVPAISSTSSLVGAFVVQPSSSSFTHVTWSEVLPGDHILTTILPTTAASSMSSGLVLHSHCTVAGRFEMRLSNVSTLAQNQSSKTYYFTRITPF